MRPRTFSAPLLALLLLAAACSSDAESSESSSVDPGSSDSGSSVPVSSAPASSADDAATSEDPVTFRLARHGRNDVRFDNYVSGGTALLELSAVDVDPESQAFSVDGTPLDTVAKGTNTFLVAGLPDGEVTITADGFETATDPVQVTNYPITGPVFSGPHQQPLFCTYEEFGLVGTGDDNCSAETSIAWGYIDDDGGFVEAAEAPGGATLIRFEQGTINRGVYQVAVADPSGGAEPIDVGKHLIYRFGGGCGTGHTQGRPLGAAVLDAESLDAGYIVATSTFNTLQTHCNDVLSAETLMMVQEHIDEQLGPIGLTVGRGGSGGAIQQYAIAQNYPGLLDALNTSASFPDSASIAGGVTDCGLLLDYWDTDEGAGFSEEARTAVQGHGTTQFCAAWKQTFLGNVDPSSGCDGVVPEAELYVPETRPDGIRCTLQDSASNLFGLDESGFGRRALDNVGIQYGLEALHDGLLTVDQFLDLNAAIGGYDIDGNITDIRTAADPELVESVYATGRVIAGDSALVDIPIIDIDLYSDLTFDIHDRFRSFSIRARLTGDETVGSPNRVIWSRPGAGLVEAIGGDGGGEDVDIWSGSEIADALIEWAETGQRPVGVADDCVIDGERIVGDDVFLEGQPCAEAYTYFGDPRTAAGAPIQNDVIKCTTVAADPSSYGVDFTDEQAERLKLVFADGVCDFTQPGVGQVTLSGTWLEY